MDRFPDLSVVKINTDENGRKVGGTICHSIEDITALQLYLAFGGKPSAQAAAKLGTEEEPSEFQDCLLCDVRYAGFKYPLRAQILGSSGPETWVGRKVRVAGCDNDCLYDNFAVQAGFPKHGRCELWKMVQLDRVLNAYFPITPRLTFDMKSGRRLPEWDHRVPTDRAVLQWVLEGEDRWLGAFRNPKGPAGDFVGIRPG